MLAVCIACNCGLGAERLSEKTHSVELNELSETYDIDLGKLAIAKAPYNFRIDLNNRRRTPVEIGFAASSCGCIVPSVSKMRLATLEVGSIQLIVDVSKSGKNEKEIFLLPDRKSERAMGIKLRITFDGFPALVFDDTSAVLDSINRVAKFIIRSSAISKDSNLEGLSIVACSERATARLSDSLKCDGISNYRELYVTSKGIDEHIETECILELSLGKTISSHKLVLWNTDKIDVRPRHCVSSQTPGGKREIRQIVRGKNLLLDGGEDMNSASIVPILVVNDLEQAIQITDFLLISTDAFIVKIQFNEDAIKDNGACTLKWMRRSEIDRDATVGDPLAESDVLF